MSRRPTIRLLLSDEFPRSWHYFAELKDLVAYLCDPEEARPGAPSLLCAFQNGACLVIRVKYYAATSNGKTYLSKRRDVLRRVSV